MPDRPAELVRRDHDHVGVGQRQLARPIASSRRGTARRPRAPAPAPACRRAGCSTVPVSELTDWIATTAARPRQRGVERVAIDRASRRPADLGVGRRAEHGVMLDRRDQPPLGLGPAQPDRQRLARARGEDHLAVPAERRLDPRPRLLERGARRAPLGVRARGIGPVREALAHRLGRLGAQRRRGGVIEIDAVGSSARELRNRRCTYIARHFRRATCAPVAHFSEVATCPPSFSPAPKAVSKAVSPRPAPARAGGDDPPPAFAGRRDDERPHRPALYKTFVDRGFATLRFNFRGVGRSQGSFDNGIGELSDAAAALDWVQSIHPEAQTTWVAGVSFGALIGMQLLMRRPEIRGFISIAPPANMYDFSFLAPCPASGIFIQGAADTVVPADRGAEAGREAAHAEAHHHPPRGNPARQPLLRERDRGPDALGRQLPRLPPRPECTIG